jgi:hypothetical protein
MRRPAVIATTPDVDSPSMIDESRRRGSPALGPMRLLAAGIPLTLLLDLTRPDGPDSDAISRHERPRQ